VILRVRPYTKYAERTKSYYDAVDRIYRDAILEAVAGLAVLGQIQSLHLILMAHP